MLRKTTGKVGGPKKCAPDWDEDEPLQRRRPRASLDELVLRILEQEEAPETLADASRCKGIVVWVGLGVCRVLVGEEEVQCGISGELAMTQQTSVAVGDVALVERNSDRALVRSVQPRRTRLSRPDPDNPNRERVIAANIDLVVVVVSIKSPPLHPRLIDRYIVAIQHGGAQGAICVNKLDLALNEEDRRRELEKLEPYKAIGLSIVACSAIEQEGTSELRSHIAGRTCVFVGHSGVGKSSLLNMLHPELGIETAAVSQGYGRGRHTTTASSLFDLGQGTRLIDTPGIRSFGLWQMTAAELAAYFPEFGQYLGGCRFRDCSHRHEPHCAVKRAVARHEISPARYETYLRLMAEV
jgi:ribosome biogenesis GTPase